MIISDGINYNNLPSWQKCGVGLYSKDIEKEEYNPKTKEATKCIRRELYLEEAIHIGNEYSELIANIMNTNKYASK